MLVKKYLDEKTNVLKENSILKFGIVFFAIASVFSSIASYRATKSQRTIIIPPTINKPIIVSDKEINVDGIKMFARYAVSMWLQHTPDSAEEKFTDLLKMVHTRYYAEVHDELMDQLETIKRLKIVSTYLVEEISVNPTDREIKIRGIRNRTSHGKEIDSGVETWLITYEIIAANFKIVRMEKLTAGKGKKNE